MNCIAGQSVAFFVSGVMRERLIMFTDITPFQLKGVTTPAVSSIMVVPHGQPIVRLLSVSSGGTKTQLGVAKARIQAWPQEEVVQSAWRFARYMLVGLIRAA
jgi:hypothetical protein